MSRVRRFPEHQVSWERRPRRAGRDGDVSSRRRHKAGGSGPRTSAPWKGHRWDQGASCCVSSRRPLRRPRKVSGGSWRPGYGPGPPGWVGAAAGVSPHLCRATPPGQSPIGKPGTGTSGAGGHLRQSRPGRPGRGARQGAAGDSEMLLKSRSQPLWTPGAFIRGVAEGANGNGRGGSSRPGPSKSQAARRRGRRRAAAGGALGRAAPAPGTRPSARGCRSRSRSRRNEEGGRGRKEGKTERSPVSGEVRKRF